MHHSIRNTRILAVATAVALCLSVAPAFADNDAKTAQMEAAFKKADKDGDGKLTKAEAEAGMPRIAKNFDRIDADKKGYVTLEDIHKAMGK